MLLRVEKTSILLSVGVSKTAGREANSVDPDCLASDMMYTVFSGLADQIFRINLDIGNTTIQQTTL